MPVDFISPVTPESCRFRIGKPVCAVLHDGSRYYGYLQAVLADRLLLVANPEGGAVPSFPISGASALRTNAHYPHPRYGYPGDGFALPLARVAFLMPLPFLLF